MLVFGDRWVALIRELDYPVAANAMDGNSEAAVAA